MKSVQNFLLCIAVLAVGCGGSSATTDTAAGDTTGGGEQTPPPPPPPDTTTTVEQAPPPPPPPAPAKVRLVHASPDAAMGTAAIFADGATTATVASLAYKAATDYMEVPAGVHQVAIRAASAAPDSAPIFSGATPELAAGSSYTVIAHGMSTGEPAFALAATADDGTAPDAGKARLRFFHALVGAPAADICVAGANARAAGTPVFTNVAYGAWGTAAGDGAEGSWALVPSGAAIHLQVREANAATPCSGRVLGNANVTPSDGVWTAVAVGRATGRPAVAKELLLVGDTSAVTTVAIGR